MFNKNNKFTLYLGIFILIYIVITNEILGKITFSLPFVIIGLALIIYYFVNNKYYDNETYSKYIKIITSDSHALRSDM
ncbi:hypothetical protein ACH36K_04490 [Clostridium sp. MB05]|jgi:energy-coupling factor transporter transmembrane protein EcfT|uniref:hypothetical protein n=1 Tax=Clostridium sp. MB05 TaxID=3376682 RepID=UPI0039819830